MEGVSEPPGQHEILCLAVVIEHLAVEPLASRAMLGVAQRSSGELAGCRTNDRPPAIMHGEVETQVGAVHGSGSFRSSSRRMRRFDLALDLLRAAHPGLWADTLHPIGKGRNEAEILNDMLLADPACRDDPA